MKDPAAVQRRVQKKGDAGVINCVPKMIKPQGTFKFDEAVNYVCKFSFGKSGQSSETTPKGLL